MATVDEISRGIYQIRTYDERIGLSFNQYLLIDQKPVLIHTGSMQMFDGILQAAKQVMDLAKIAYVFISHFESDECGSLSRWLTIAPGLIPVTSAVTARQLQGFGISDQALTARDEDRLELGERTLGFVSYPSEMHLWEGLLAFEESERTLFSADLFIRRGPVPAALVREGPAALAIPRQAIPGDEERAACLARIKALRPSILAPGHGPAVDIREERSSLGSLPSGTSARVPLVRLRLRLRLSSRSCFEDLAHFDGGFG